MITHCLYAIIPICILHAGSGVVRIDPLHLLAECCKKELNQVLSVLSVSMVFCVCILWFIRATFVLTSACVCMYSVSWLLLVKLLVLTSNWLERLLWASLTMASGSSSQSPGWRVFTIFLVYCVDSLFDCMLCLCCSRAYVIYFILIWHDIACLCWKCR